MTQSDLDSIYRDFRSVLHAIASRYLRDEALAEEMVSETFRRYIEARPRMRSQALPVQRAFLCTTLRNLLARPRLVLVPLEEDDAVSAPEPEDLPPWADYTDDHLQDAIARLPESYRTPLLLAYFEGLSHKAIAARLGCTSLAVTMRLFKAKRRLKGLLEQTRERKDAKR